MTQRSSVEDAYGNASVILFPIGSPEVDDAADDRLTGGNGSIRAQSDDLGEISGTADYDVRGTELGSTTGSLFSWTGEQNDDETGLTYLRARHYSPTYSRFLSVDPIQPNAGGTQGFNAYAYAQNNPATLTDPSGMLAGSWDDFPGYSDLTQAGKEAFHESRRIIGCWKTYQGNMAKIADCVLGEMESGGTRRHGRAWAAVVRSAVEEAVLLAAHTGNVVLNVLLPVLPIVFYEARKVSHSIAGVANEYRTTLHHYWDVGLQAAALFIYANYYFTYQYFEYRNRHIDRLGIARYPIYMLLAPLDAPLYAREAVFLAGDIALNEVIRKTGVDRGSRELNDEGLITEINIEAISSNLPPSWFNRDAWVPGWHCDQCKDQVPREPGRVDFHFLWWDHFYVDPDYGN